jgi:hypothetical protein
MSKESISRVKTFVEERKKMRGLDPNEIAQIQVGSEKEAALTVADLEALLADAGRHQHWRDKWRTLYSFQDPQISSEQVDSLIDADIERTARRI